MSYDPDEPIFPPGIPEDYKNQILEHRRVHAAHTQDNTHAVRMLMDDLNSDQLTALDMIVSACMSSEYNAAYFRGQITALLHIKYDVCPCGLEHDPTKSLQLPEITRPGAPVMPNAEEYWKGRELDDVELPEDYNPDNGERMEPWEPKEDGPENMPEDERIRLISRYNLVPVYNDEHTEVTHFQCMGCGVDYVSLEDRMLKPPGPAGCEGCQQKERWG